MFYSPNLKLHVTFIESFDRIDKRIITLQDPIKASNLNPLRLEYLENLILSTDILKNVFFMELIVSQRVLIALKSYSLNFELNLRNQKLSLMLDWFLNLALVMLPNISGINLLNSSLTRTFFPLITPYNLIFSTKITNHLKLVSKSA